MPQNSADSEKKSVQSAKSAEVSALRASTSLRLKSSSLLDTRVVYCGDNLEQPARLPDACVYLIYIDPPFNSNRNSEVFRGETREKRAFEDRDESPAFHAFFRGNKINKPKSAPSLPAAMI
jgi:hypothetical protein